MAEPPPAGHGDAPEGAGVGGEPPPAAGAAAAAAGGGDGGGGGGGGADGGGVAQQAAANIMAAAQPAAPPDWLDAEGNYLPEFLEGTQGGLLPRYKAFHYETMTFADLAEACFPDPMVGTWVSLREGEGLKGSAVQPLEWEIFPKLRLLGFFPAIMPSTSARDKLRKKSPLGNQYMHKFDKWDVRPNRSGNIYCAECMYLKTDNHLEATLCKIAEVHFTIEEDEAGENQAAILTVTAIYPHNKGCRACNNVEDRLSSVIQETRAGSGRAILKFPLEYIVGPAYLRIIQLLNTITDPGQAPGKLIQLGHKVL